LPEQRSWSSLVRWRQRGPVAMVAMRDQRILPWPPAESRIAVATAPRRPRTQPILVILGADRLEPVVEPSPWPAPMAKVRQNLAWALRLTKLVMLPLAAGPALARFGCCCSPSLLAPADGTQFRSRWCSIAPVPAWSPLTPSPPGPGSLLEGIDALGQSRNQLELLRQWLPAHGLLPAGRLGC